MKFTYSILAAAGLTTAQNFAGVPTCATACLASAIQAVGCPLTDPACQCGPSKAAVGASAAPCLIRSCGASDLISAQSAGEALCVALTATPTGGSGSSSTGGNTAGPTATTTTTTSRSGGGSTTTATTSAPTFQTTPPTTTSRATNGTSGGGAGGNGTVVNPTPNPSSTRQPGAAAMASPVMLGVGAVAAVLGAIAAL